MPHRETSHSDVCATANHLKGLIIEQSQDVVLIRELVADVGAMTEKLQMRQREYETLRTTVGELHRRMGDVVFVRDIENAFGTMRVYPSGRVTGEAFLSAVEIVRKSAWVQEVHCLRPLMDLTLKLYAALLSVKGRRRWPPDSFDGAEAKYQAWLPAEPHRGMLLEALRNAEAHVPKEPAPGEEPIVQFEDGGRIPMSQIVITSRGSLGKRVSDAC